MVIIDPRENSNNEGSCFSCAGLGLSDHLFRTKVSKSRAVDIDKRHDVRCVEDPEGGVGGPSLESLMACGSSYWSDLE